MPLIGLEQTSGGSRTKAGSHFCYPEAILHSLQGPGWNPEHLDRLPNCGILQPCQSPWNTPLLRVQKPGTEDFRPVQDLCAVHSANVTLHPVVPNPYTLVGLIPAEVKFFTCLDLKDKFFCICLAPQSQPFFAFQWENPNNEEKGN
jgi:hypothetical protein